MLNREEKIALIERALREKIPRDPFTRRVVSEGWVQTITPGVRSEPQNRVLLSVLAPSEVKKRIASTLETYRALGLPFHWVVSPASRPFDLGERLQAAGFEVSHRAAGMIAEVSALHSVAMSSPVTHEIVTRSNVEDWVHVQSVGWGATPEGTERMREATQWILAKRDERVVDLVFRLNGALYGGCSVEFYGDSAFLLSAVVLPEHRGRGLMRPALAAILQLCRERGVSHVTTHALRNTSAPMLARLGFEDVCNLLYYTYMGERASA
ncbi:GNAT family N-acetyltransferase [Polyangium aurulentum]|uniref:GNAT family N-acetyltransferase n=1 Tax=Polyangium aurulentum TaxID=2567896 RepID=UPI00146F5555|nr:GNAT family N-acetyltransferase [Polyangium aurulentum]UQA57319.1 GNAT family N-acetyltransferase [Polyangium aurulentum]